MISGDKRPRIEDYDEMDVRSDTEEFLEGFSETVLQKQIAYVISTIAIAFLKGKEVTFKNEQGEALNAVCLPTPNYIRYAYKIGEKLGEIEWPDDKDLCCHPRELFATLNQNPYFTSCLAAKYVTKEYREPPYRLLRHIKRLKSDMPVVKEIWMHFHRLLKELSPRICSREEWNNAVSTAKRTVRDGNADKKWLDFGNAAVVYNHQALHTYILKLSEEQPNFISCFERVCNEWDQLKTRWQAENPFTESKSLIRAINNLHRSI